ncbi:hypothetical protein M413DRAFT_164367 [Hebeloma cylindrosporum]|uniref:Uncharacterized protein n=1 Tax=Hebeloma cylindrosporum TaxID=76867 RepID=A0A0C2XS90_HEBCY|nr:hypothetical protein M413DRAFT_164367 [Hebeloma cylindrosporum h7]
MRCLHRRMYAQDRAEMIASMTAPVIHAWNYVSSRISRVVSHHSDLRPQFRLRQIQCLLTCWRKRRVGDYGYLEVDGTRRDKEELGEHRKHPARSTSETIVDKCGEGCAGRGRAGG